MNTASPDGFDRRFLWKSLAVLVVTIGIFVAYFHGGIIVVSDRHSTILSLGLMAVVICIIMWPCRDPISGPPKSARFYLRPGPSGARPFDLDKAQAEV